MLIGLTFGAKEHNVATSIRGGLLGAVEDESVRNVMRRVAASTSADTAELCHPPFAPEQLPEALGTILTFSYTNKISAPRPGWSCSSPRRRIRSMMASSMRCAMRGQTRPG
jgi:hypothetical protein